MADQLTASSPTVERLARLGYLPKSKPPPPGVAAAPVAYAAREVLDAIRRYAEFHGLPTADPDVVARHMALPCCGRPDIPDSARAAAAGPCRWPHKAIRFWCGVAMKGYDAVEVGRIYRDAVESWVAVCGITATVEFAAGREAWANVVSKAGPIDGPSNVLAWSQLPCGVGETTTLQQLYDSLDAYYSFSRRFFQAIFGHEHGHALGLDHDRTGALMQPTIREGLYLPQQSDIAQVQSRYGKPVAPPVPTPTPTPVPPSGVVAEFVGTNGYRIQVVKP